MTDEPKQPFDGLNQDKVIDAVESLGYCSDLRVFALNSYENRVYQVGIEDHEPVIAKFYRPERWSDKQILEEHEFSLLLAEHEIPVIAPCKNSDGQTLFNCQGYLFTIYPRRGGHAPELENLDTLYTLGQHIGRIHALGATKSFTYRPHLDIQSHALDSRDYLLANNALPASLLESYKAITHYLIEKLTGQFNKTPYKSIRIHGDCHPGNILSRSESLYIVDLDDCRSGPAIQDLWMLLSGDLTQKTIQMSALLEGYQEFHDFDKRELHLIEALRTLRLMHYAGWLAKRWHDPAFPKAFPWFNTERYWAEHILELKEQLSELDSDIITLN